MVIHRPIKKFSTIFSIEQYSSLTNWFLTSLLKATLAIVVISTIALHQAEAREIPYGGDEVEVYVLPNEPTQIKFPDKISGGFVRKNSTISIKRVGKDLIIFPKDEIADDGEAIIVRLKDGRSFSLRIQQAADTKSRDNEVKIEDITQTGVDISSETKLPPYFREKLDTAPPTRVSGLMREMILSSEFGKPKINGYRLSESYRNQVVFDDGTLKATIKSIYIGSNLWGYVLEAENLLEQSQILNPGTFRLDGTRAISATRWELAAKPMTFENKIAGAHKTKLYIITRSK